MVRRFTWVALTLGLVCAATQSVHAQVISFDNIVNPPTNGTTLSPTAQAIVNDQRLAQHEVALAIFYLKHNRTNILAGNDALYNSIYGQFYVPNNPFTGLYNQTTKFGNYQARVDPLNPRRTILVPVAGPLHSNPAQFSDVLTTFQNIQKSMTHPTRYEWGPDFGNPGAVKPLDTFGNQVVLTGDLKFGTGAFISAGGTRGFLEWGLSTSISDLNTTANGPIPWYLDEGIPKSDGGSEKTEPYAFTHDFMTIYGQDWSVKTGPIPGFNIETIGESFVTMQQQTSPGFGRFFPPTFAPTQFNQLDMIIQSFAEQLPTTLGTSGSGQGVSGFTAFQPGIYAGLVDSVGTNSPEFAQTFDSGSYAEFADLVGTSNLDVNSLPPLGKSGSFLGDFHSATNANFQSFLPVLGP